VFARFGIADEALTRLVEDGLPAHRTDDGVLFDGGDLENVALLLPDSPRRRTVETWARTLDRVQRPGTELVVHYVDRRAGAAPALPVPAGAIPREPALPRSTASFTWRPRLEWPEPPAVLRPALRDLAAMAFTLLPAALRADTGFSRRTGLTDCVVAAGVLLEEAAAAGIPARRATGLLLASPLATLHSWTEVSCGDTWVPLDPALIGLLRGHGLGAAGWPPERSPGALLAPFPDGRLDAPPGGGGVFVEVR
jgi:hypothetical protein